MSNGQGEESASGPVEFSTYASGVLIARKYVLTRVIGEGGMGAVWLARNRSLDIDVAIELIRRADSTDEHCERLLQEARAAARIEHPSVVRIFDFGETEQGDPFIVMELLRGEDLRDLLHRDKRIPADDAVPVVLCVASALVAAHAKGIVHRDLKPENVFLVPGEGGVVVPKVVDFGIAKLHEREGGRSITVSGMLVGSPDYMSPEQSRGAADLDERSDVWSLSVLLYELITGRLPFEGQNYNALIAAILTEPPLPSTALLAGDAELWSILEKGLAKPREQRWQTMRELGKELASWAVDHGIETDAAGASIPRHWLATSKRNLARLSISGISSSDTNPPPPLSSRISSHDRQVTSSRAPPADSRRSTGASVVPAAAPRSSKRSALIAVAAVAGGLGVLIAILAAHRSPDSGPEQTSAHAASAFPTEPVTASAPGPPAPPSAAESAAPEPTTEPTATASARARGPKGGGAKPGASKGGAAPAKPGMPVPKEAPF